MCNTSSTIEGLANCMMSLFIVPNKVCFFYWIKVLTNEIVDDINAILTAIVTSVDVNAVGSDGKTALHWTSKLNNTSASHILLQRGANVQLRDVSNGL